MVTQYSRYTQPSVVVQMNIHSLLNRLYKIYNFCTLVVFQNLYTNYPGYILFTNYRKTLYINCTLFNCLIIVSGYNKIVHFLIKNELQCPYRKDVVVKPELMLQVTPLHANNMTWYTHPTMTIVMLLCSYHIKNCDNQIICIQPNHNHKITIYS